MKGEVKKLVRDRGFGFIRAEDGREIFFHFSALQPGVFDTLVEGDAVEFQVEQGNKGPRATQMSVIA
ncbi:MAG: cold shock domain-containing protein [Candidatus Tectomicrobia bacterium]|nr:cold shock domain-containing protein [Candidatus Tectomicrobia bacterium]